MALRRLLDAVGVLLSQRDAFVPLWGPQEWRVLWSALSVELCGVGRWFVQTARAAQLRPDRTSASLNIYFLGNSSWKLCCSTMSNVLTNACA